jgi:hypothetical protein
MSNPPKRMTEQAHATDSPSVFENHGPGEGLSTAVE